MIHPTGNTRAKSMITLSEGLERVSGDHRLQAKIGLNHGFSGLLQQTRTAPREEASYRV